MKFILALLLIFGILSNLAVGAEVSLEISGISNFIKYSGNIEKGDLDKLQKVFGKVAKSSPSDAGLSVMSFLVLNSLGGNVNEAMRIGRWMRQNNFGVVFPKDAKCFSSCVYLLAAGLTRDPSLGKVGIHRPYYSEIFRGDVAVGMDQVLKESRSFFHDMNIPERFVDSMFSVPPEDVKVLTEKELSAYRLNQDYIVYKERRDISFSEYYGLTRIEYMQRRKDATAAQERNCRQETTSDFLKCYKLYEKKYGLTPADN